MYSPTTRLLTVLELLQSYRQMNGAELARRLEVGERTVRRYIVMLQDMGIPVEASHGPYGAYQLRRGYKLPPLVFTDAEAVALTLGLLAIRESQFPVDVAAVEGVLAKIERLMPEKLLLQARALQEAITFNTLTHPAPQLRSDFITTLSLAVQECRQVHLRYQSWQGEESERDFDPYGIVYNEGYWYTAGYCHLRQDLRTFRLDRILALEPVEGSFTRPTDFDVLGHVLDAVASMPGLEQIEVLLKTSLERAREFIPVELGRLEAVEEGVILRRSATQLDWVAHILIQADFPVQVIRTAELKKVIRRLGTNALRITADGGG